MKGKHSRPRRRPRLAPWAVGAMTGLTAFGVTAALPTTLQDATTESVAAVQAVPQQRTAPHLAESQRQVRTPEQARPQAQAPVQAQVQKEFKAPAKTKPSSGSTSQKQTASKKQDVPRQRTADPASDARSEIIARARTWHPHSDQRVPYSQTATHKGYRTDCSGYVSMALGLPKPGTNTVGLTSSRYTERIAMSELKKGDLVMDALGSNTTRHVVIFEKWADKAHTSYWAYEQRGRYGTDHRTLDYGLSSDDEYKAYRPTSLIK
ncbi:C40 family peptidase [Actinomadura sp. WMMA1423]|uniref:C40 family peptidase n=1 Tax=Actinomadura sp. WMMA1423 TaxID=2591108 RepID=UPI001146773C|nr:C40 family peptidase [Actinomadura sp. WMMA1423]